MGSRNCKDQVIFRYKSWFFVLGAIYLVIIIIEAIYRMELSVFVLETTDTTKTNKDLPE